MDEVSISRQHFYERLGYAAHGFAHIHPPYRNGCKGHELVVMACPAISVDAYHDFASYLNRTVMGDSPSE